jgi:hypothetical protein
VHDGTAVGPVRALTAHRLTPPVTAENLDTAEAEFEGAARRLFDQVGGTVQSGPEEITAAGKPGLRFQATGTHDGTPFESTLVLIFDGTTQYILNCSHTAEWAKEIERGCEQIVRTFMVETDSTLPPAAETHPRAGHWRRRRRHQEPEKSTFLTSRWGTVSPIRRRLGKRSPASSPCPARSRTARRYTPQ